MKIKNFYLYITLTTIILTGTSCCASSDISYTKHKINNSHAHLLKFPLSKFDITPIAAWQIQGNRKETLKSISRETNAVAAINGGFFHMNSASAGILRISGHWLGIAYKPRGAIAWNNKDQFLFGYPNTISSIESLAPDKLKINSMNVSRDKSKPIIFSEPTHKQDMLSLNNSCFIAFNNERIIYKSTTSIDVPKGGYVYYHPRKEVCMNSDIKIGDMFSFKVSVQPRKTESSTDVGDIWQEMPHILGGTPMLIFNGKKVENIHKQAIADFIYKGHARTVIGRNANSDILLLVVEEDPFENKSGATLDEVTEFMIKQGCEFALNLDGGSSSSMFLAEDVTGDGYESLGYANISMISNALIITKK